MPVSPRQIVQGEAIVPALWNDPVNTLADKLNGNIDNSDISASAAIDSSKIAFTTSGLIIQQSQTDVATSTTGTTLIPHDDTIPQNTEGDQYMSVSFTPLKSSSTLYIETLIFLSSSVINNLIAALFKDSDAGALVAAVEVCDTATGIYALRFTHQMTSGTTSAITFKVRGGGSFAGTTTFNGSGGARKLGGVLKSYIRVTEKI